MIPSSFCCFLPAKSSCMSVCCANNPFRVPLGFRQYSRIVRRLENLTCSRSLILKISNNCPTSEDSRSTKCVAESYSTVSGDARQSATLRLKGALAHAGDVILIERHTYCNPPNKTVPKLQKDNWNMLASRQHSQAGRLLKRRLSQVSVHLKRAHSHVS